MVIAGFSKLTTTTAGSIKLTPKARSLAVSIQATWNRSSEQV
ncbi:MAG TPA: hypothetical protein V6C64_12570 [Microcoleaceae cyanobacterium]